MVSKKWYGNMSGRLICMPCVGYSPPGGVYCAPALPARCNARSYPSFALCRRAGAGRGVACCCWLHASCAHCAADAILAGQQPRVRAAVCSLAWQLLLWSQPGFAAHFIPPAAYTAELVPASQVRAMGRLHRLLVQTCKRATVCSWRPGLCCSPSRVSCPCLMRPSFTQHGYACVW